MDATSLSQIASWSEAELLAGDPRARVQGVSNNTRTLQAGELYISLKGERFDGNQFMTQALEKGAVGALYDGTVPEGLPASFGLLRVNDASIGLTTLARSWRHQLSLRSIVLTGSSGKTTTKNFTTLLLQSALRVVSTQGNLNNHFGLPLSILKASKVDQVAVWEIGMNHRGEIAPLATLAKPDIAMITNIGTAHIGLLGSREAIAEEKGDLLAQLPAHGLAILPAADDFYEHLKKRTTARIFSVGIDVGDLQATDLMSSSLGTHFRVCYQGASWPAFLPVIGAHMVQNALLALAAGLECGLSLEQGIHALTKVQSYKGRLMVRPLRDITLLDDSYNANPDSMEAALTAMADFPTRRRIGFLGRMGELGDYALQGYQRVAQKAAQVLDLLVVIGEEALPLAQAARQLGMKEVYEVSNNQEALELATVLISTGDLVLVKGSASARLHEIAEQLAKFFSPSV